ncbi:hypothetical protein [Winogradskyella bathintestinalis]|uniref:Lipoprotein n=1 Tax=Winogradskyella bathintestinalis TaxID=3035208 RepID=A0ABT7ZX37_9FLAO|nr:hypothetical protein [Winogradskyella bathintestinalis]MDN3493496.1 hypothetical protein [Winogradskyella bathintestinalis]
MKSTFFMLLLALSMTACNESTRKIGLDGSAEKQVQRDSSKVAIADLPILIDSTDYLIHPIGYITDNSKYSSYSKKSHQKTYNISRYHNFNITGEFSNLKFQQLNSEKITALTDKIVEITSIRFLENIRIQTGRQYLVYTIRDLDTNNDAKINSKDFESLYISNINGENLKKISPELTQLVDWKIIPQLNRLYFKSIADTNMDGEFDKKDNLNYHFVDLDDNVMNVVSYQPI